MPTVVLTLTTEEMRRIVDALSATRSKEAADLDISIANKIIASSEVLYNIQLGENSDE